MAIIKTDIVQNKYTDLFLYDISERCNNSYEWIPLSSINKIEIIMNKTSSIFKTNHIYRFDNTKKAYVLSYEEYENTDCACYECLKTLILEVNGNIQIYECKFKNPTAQEIIDELNGQNNLDVEFYLDGNRINAISLYEGEDIYIKIIDGTLLPYIKWNKGIYRGNNFNWNDVNLIQNDFSFQIYAQDIELWEEIPEGYIDFTINIEYSLIEGDYLYIEEYTEFLYKQTEMYRAKMFEYIAKNFNNFENVEQRWQTDFEIFMQKSVYFDALYKAFLSSIEIGDKNRSYELLQYLINYKELNPII